MHTTPDPKTFAELIATPKPLLVQIALEEGLVRTPAEATTLTTMPIHRLVFELMEHRIIAAQKRRVRKAEKARERAIHRLKASYTTYVHRQKRREEVEARRKKREAAAADRLARSDV